VQIIRRRHFQVEPPLGLQNFPFAKVAGGLGDFSRDLRILQLCRQLQPMGKERVSQQHRKFRAPLGIAGGSGSPQIRPVQHVVMDQRSHVHQFHDHGQVADRFGPPSGHLAGQQHQGRPQTLAPAFQGVPHITFRPGIELGGLVQNPGLNLL